ncbi:MAG: flagellar hook-associated protein FlgK [Proteobacteria bacterium]|nr:flagellar hook-associated protein FlgK [Pseudomonadota bacterium]
MPSIYDVGSSALNSMQRAIATTGHNIANVNTEGYSRQEVLFGTRTPENVGQVEIGTGVEVSNIRRAHDHFLMTDVQSRSSSNGYFQLYAKTAQSVDGLLADPSTGIAPAINQFFAAMEAVASNPSSIPEREVLLSQAEILTQRFNYVDTRLSEFAEELNTRMANMTNNINALAIDIAQLNESIASFKSGSRGMPNDLLDRRDQAITDLSNLIGVQTTTQEDGSINVLIGKGQRLVLGNNAEQLRMVLPATQDGPSQLYLSVPSGAESEVTSKLVGGELGGVLDAGIKLINKARREVGLLAVGISETFNRQHSQGSDLNGDQGTAFFSNLSATVIGSKDNSGLLTVAANITQEQNLTGDGYSIRYEDAGIRLTNLSSGESQIVDAGVLELPGLNITVPERADGVDGDIFFVEPTLGTASSMGVFLTDPSKIAAANFGSAVGDNRNMLSLIDLRDAKTLKAGTQGYISLYGSTLSSIAVETRSAISNAETESSLLRSAEDRLESVRGVNLDEEATNLIRYQQAYQAAAQVISVANEIFDTLLMASR